MQSQIEVNVSMSKFKIYSKMYLQDHTLIFDHIIFLILLFVSLYISLPFYFILLMFVLAI